MIRAHDMSTQENKNAKFSPNTARDTDITHRTSCLLRQAHDRVYLSELFCFLRNHIEAFVSKGGDCTDESNSAGGTTYDPRDNGRVGVRCVHCAQKEWPQMPKGSVFYPRSIRGIYQAVQNYHRLHLLDCEATPEEVKREFVELKSTRRGRSSQEALQYWEECCRKMGMVDTANGICLQTGYFVEDSSMASRYFDKRSTQYSFDSIKSSPELAVSDAASAVALKEMANDEREVVTDRCDTRGSFECPNYSIAGPSILVQKAASASYSQGGMERSVCVLTSAIETKRKRCPNVSNESSNGNATGQTSSLLHHAKDHLFLNELFCFVRHNVEAFVSSKNDGKVGLRCVHCARRNKDTRPGNKPRTKGSETFPRSIRLVYQAVRNLQRYHLQACPTMPHEVKAKYNALKSWTGRSSQNAPKFWEECCREMGMVDTTDGIRLRTGYFENRESEDAAALSCREDGAPAPNIPIRRSLEASASAPLLPNPPDMEEQGRSRCHQKEVATVLSASTVESHVDAIPCGTTLPEHQTHQCDLLPERKGNQTFHGDSSPTSQVESQTDEVSPDTSTSVWIDLQKSLLEDGNKCDKLSVSLSYQKALDRVKLALDVIETAQQIRQLPPVMPVLTEEKKLSDEQAVELHSLGIELYELFSSGISPFRAVDKNGFNTSSVMFDGNKGTFHGDNDEKQKKKRERQPKMSGYVPLTEFGLPPTICRLVSSLLNHRESCERCNYECIDDVKEDLRIMASKPEMFLFRTASCNLQLSPDALYGREDETAKLLEAYSRAIDPAGRQTKEIVFISGYSGTGKSSLVQNLRGHFIKKGACFVSGKFDAMQQLQPLSSIVSAMNDYCSLLSESRSRIHEVREAVETALGNEGRAVLSSLIPNLEKIISSADPKLEVPCANGREALQRLIFMIRMLFRATCSFSYPVVLFLDDLQWADSVSLTLMQGLISDPAIKGLLVIGCYRDNEVTSDHPLMSTLADIKRSGDTSITSICIGNLNVKNISSLLSDALLLTPNMVRSLAEAVLQKTGGNALFLVQFLSSLHNEGLIRYSLSSRQWDWDTQKICRKDIADGVAELLAAKLQSMAPEVLGALKTAAAFGAQCEEELLHILDKAPERIESTVIALDAAVAEGIMNKVDSAYIFAHDQVQQAAYLLIPDSERASFHLLLGRTLWKCCSENELKKHLFVLVYQLHKGSSLISDHDEQVALARLSLRAGEMASAMSAFLPSECYLTAGIRMLNEDDWFCCRDLCVDIFSLCAETQYILGDFDAMQGNLDKLLTNGRTLQEKLRAYHTLILSMGAQGRALDAISTASRILPELGEALPLDVTKATVKQELGLTETLLSAVCADTEDSLLQMKPMEDAEKREAMKILHVLLHYAFTEKKILLPVLVCRMVRISISYGLCKESAHAFAFYGMISLNTMGKYYDGHRYARVAISIIDRFQAREFFARVHVIVYLLIKPWAEPIQACLPPLKRAIEVGLATGDILYSMIAAHSYAGCALFAGEALGPLMDEMNLHSKQMIDIKQRYVHTNSGPMRLFAQNLLGRSADPTRLVEDIMDEGDPLDSPGDTRSNQAAMFTYLYRLWLQYLFGNYHEAWNTVEEYEEIGNGSSKLISFPAACSTVFFPCLTALALAREKEEPIYMKTIDSNLAKMEEWAQLAPWNCLNKLQLLRAEYAFLKKDFILAATCFDHAVELSAKHRLVNDQGLALERSGIFHLERGDNDTASSLFARARECYIKWGAWSKVWHVEERYL